MSSTNKTTNYNLNQYVGTDIQRRTDYNADMLAIDTALKGLEDNKAEKGTAYNRIDSNIAVIQGVPQGGAKYLGGGNQTGAIKIKLPVAKQNTMFKFRIKINGYSTGGKQSNAEYIVKGYNQAGGFGSNYDGQTNCQVTVVKDNLSTMTPVFYFCTGATEDYILIGEITDIHVSKAVVIDDVEAHYNYISLWASGWKISLVTALETLTSSQQVAVTPSLNATHLAGAQLSTDVTMAGNSDTLIPSQKAAKTYVAAQIAALVNSSPATLDTLNELAAALGNDPNFATTMVNSLAGKVNNSDVSTSRTANKIAQRDANGNIAGVINLNGTLINVLASPDLNTLLATGFYYATTATNKPPNAQNGYVNVYAYTSGYVLQEYINFDNSGRYTRVYNNNTWSSWKNVFQDEGTSLAANRYTKLSNGLILQWGSVTNLGQYAGTAVTFPVAFPNDCTSVQCTVAVTAGKNGYSGQAQAVGTTKTGFTAYNAVSVSPINMTWFAVGY